MRKIIALNIFMATVIFGGMLFVALDFAFNITGKLGTDKSNNAPIIVESNAQRELTLPLADGEKVHSIQSAGDQIIIHVGKPGENGRILIVSAISAKHRATVNIVSPPDQAPITDTAE